MSKRRILQFCLLIFAILYTADTGAQWVKMNGVSENNIRDLEYLNGNYFAATHGSGIAKSTDNGLNWSATSLNYILGEALLVFNNNLVAGVQQNGVYYTTNNGTNWIQTNFENKWVHGLGKFSNTILLGNSIEYRIYSTTNYGTNWIFRLDRMAYCFETIGNTLFAGTTNGIYTSTNSGINFSPLNLQGYQVYTIKYKDDTTLFAGLKNNSAGYGAVYRSFNSGNFWHMTSLNNVTINSIVVNGNYTFAGTDNGVYISSNNGYSWRQKKRWIAKNKNECFAG